MQSGPHEPRSSCEQTARLWPQDVVVSCDVISPPPAVSVCGRSLPCGQLERAAEELLDCWSTHGSDGQIYPNLPNGTEQQTASGDWTLGKNISKRLNESWLTKTGSSWEIQNTEDYIQIIIMMLLQSGSVWSHPPFEESSSIGCLKAVMSLKVQRNNTTLSCSFLIGAIFTKNQTGIPAAQTGSQRDGPHRNNLPEQLRTLTGRTGRESPYIPELYVRLNVMIVLERRVKPLMDLLT